MKIGTNKVTVSNKKLGKKMDIGVLQQKGSDGNATVSQHFMLSPNYYVTNGAQFFIEYVHR